MTAPVRLCLFPIGVHSSERPANGFETRRHLTQDSTENKGRSQPHGGVPGSIGAAATSVGAIADGVLRRAEGLGETLASPFAESRLRLGVTGLARAGKTVFISSLVANLMDRGRMGQLSAERDGRIEAVYLQPQPDDTVPRFDFETHLAALTGADPSWPDSTRAVSELRVSIRYRPRGVLSGLTGPRVLHLDIVDYPGEWLLDLALLDKDYQSWSAEVLGRIENRAEGRAFRAAMVSEAELGAAPHDEAVAQKLAAQFASYLNSARMAGYYDCTPGRFLLPGDLAGSPVLTFAPLPPSQTPRGSLAREMARRFEAYKAKVVRPFFHEHFARIDRQVVLVDALSALHSGPQTLEDLRLGMADILSAFRPGQNRFLAQLFRGKRVEKILFAATKADHLHHLQHAKMASLIEAMTREARDRAQFSGAETGALALASLRATTEEIRNYEGEDLPCVRGISAQSGRAAVFYPGALPKDPSFLLAPARSGELDWADNAFSTMHFAPQPLTLRPGEGPPHIRLDRAAEFLIGDRL